MGLGDEIMALGRLEAQYEESGEPAKVVDANGRDRFHIVWEGNPAYSKEATRKIIDGPGARPYIKFNSGNAKFNLEHTARAGRIFIPEEYNRKHPLPPYAIVSPHLKKLASPNKSYGFDRWAAVIKNFPIPVYQLIQDYSEKILPGALVLYTPHLYHALAMIKDAAVVMCNEGGTHHMAASLKVPAVVFFGSFIPPSVTGYSFHYNIGIESPHGYCGKWTRCKECDELKKTIEPNTIREKAILMMEKNNGN